jgi:hypothetical protein
MMEGVPEFRRTTRERGLGFCFHLEREGHRPDHLENLVNRSCATIVEDIPVFPPRRWIHQLADRVSGPVMAVDCDCVVPMRTVNH